MKSIDFLVVVDIAMDTQPTRKEGFCGLAKDAQEELDDGTSKVALNWCIKQSKKISSQHIILKAPYKKVTMLINSIIVEALKV